MGYSTYYTEIIVAISIGNVSLLVKHILRAFYHYAGILLFYEATVFQLLLCMAAVVYINLVRYQQYNTLQQYLLSCLTWLIQGASLLPTNPFMCRNSWLPATLSLSKLYGG